jgi:hypothetical protein
VAELFVFVDCFLARALASKRSSPLIWKEQQQLGPQAVSFLLHQQLLFVGF